MKQLVNTARLLNPRAVLIVGASALLCISDGVGPRLLPLPALVETASPTPAHERGDAASRTPSRVRTTTRVEMVPAPQARAAAERQPQQAAAHTPKFILPLPRLAQSRGQDFRTHARESSAHFSRPQGRAPPRRLA